MQMVSVEKMAFYWRILIKLYVGGQFALHLSIQDFLKKPMYIYLSVQWIKNTKYIFDNIVAYFLFIGQFFVKDKFL
jgi:hypothetical protein